VIGNETGRTVFETAAIVALGMVVFAVALTYAAPILLLETARDSARDLQSQALLARTEAVTRDRDCRFMVNTRRRAAFVMDTLGTASTADDQLLHRMSLSSRVEFESPQGDEPVTLERVGGEESPWYHATFAADGTLRAGAGILVLHGTEGYSKMIVDERGGLRTEYWDGKSWRAL
jgi:hypothetical protein